jgi:hypothetical protein
MLKKIFKGCLTVIVAVAVIFVSISLFYYFSQKSKIERTII